MLRAPLLRSRVLYTGVSRPQHGAQWQLLQSRAPAVTFQQRFYADPPKLPDQTVLPGSSSSSKASDESKSPSSTTGDQPENVPRAPPTPSEAQSTFVKTSSSVGVPTGAGTASATASTPAPPSPKRKPRRWRRFFLSLLLLSGLSYAGGVYYSLVSDNWHDFFTEYVPFGEDAVAYFEEREFRRRFPQSSSSASKAYPQIRGESKVTIPGKGGLSSKVVEEGKESDLGARSGRHLSALKDNQPAHAQQSPSSATPAEKTTAVEKGKEKAQAATKSVVGAAPKKEERSASPAPQSADQPKTQGKEKAEAAKPATPAQRIDPLNVPAAEEPVVQDVVRILNDIITVVNADNASGKFNSAISKARDEIAKVAQNITSLRASEKKAAEDKIQSNHSEFDEAAKELMRRVEDELRDQEARWKEEYETEREKLSKTYQNKLNNELESTRKVYDQKLKNELLEQSIALSNKFATDIRNRVEAERNGRLSKLNELSSGVAELEKLTGEWNAVVDSNLKTQHLHVAIDAVRSALDNPTSSRPQPFVSELAALKEIASDDAIVNAAIASINPTSYQRGIPSSAQLVDRFRRVASEVRKAFLLPENAGVASHAMSWALSHATFKKEGMPVGDDVESVLARTETLLEEGSLDDAAREMNGLTGAARELSRDWLAECRRVLEVRQALDVVETEAKLQSLLVG
ncbi:MAG: Formation of crista junctions protein 1 [Bogoriella megaspora]|nr:MAG: Formation of crista junctions protein 1 [Bogoriella megaspora]